MLITDKTTIQNNNKMQKAKELINKCEYIKAIGEINNEIRILLSMLHVCFHGIGNESRWQYYNMRLNAPERAGIIKKYLKKEITTKSGKPIIIVPAEEGIGDELLYTTYLHLLENKAGHIYVECDNRLKFLFERTYNSGKFTFLERKEKSNQLFKYIEKSNMCILSSDLTRSLNPNFEPNKTIPLNIYRPIIKDLGTKNKPNIGISHYTSSKRKSAMPEKDFLHKMINICKNCTFFNLQPNSCQIENTKTLPGFDYYNDIPLLAQLICSLDMVVTIDNFMAHLCGRLHKKCLLITLKNCNTRWLMANGDCSAYYPTVKHIRGNSFDSWNDVLDRVIKELKNEIN